MVKVLKANERGSADHGWLKSFHTFSFGDYYNPSRMGFGPLRVINQDRIEGGTGFSTHPHQDMEIISYVIDGALEHKDSMGNATIIHPEEVQRLSAGTGIRHSEYNHIKDKTSHFLQIWVIPDKKGYTPSYGQKSFSGRLRENKLVLVASNHGAEDSISLNQDVNIFVAKSTLANEQDMAFMPNRLVWIQAISGQIEAFGNTLQPGDGLAAENKEHLHLSWSAKSEFMLFDMTRI